MIQGMRSEIRNVDGGGVGGGWVGRCGSGRGVSVFTHV